MPLRRMIYDVYLRHIDATDTDPLIANMAAGAPVEYRVELLHQDMLRGEIEGPRAHVPGPDVAPLTATTFWIYLAMGRLGLYAGEWQQFKLHDLVGFDQVKSTNPADTDPVTGRPLAPPVDPTQPAAASPSPSPSPVTSGTSPAGWEGLTPTRID